MVRETVNKGVQMKMNRWNQWMVAGLGVCLVGSASFVKAESLKLGDKIPEATVKMKSVDGRDISIAGVADEKGTKGTLVIFSCNHCPYARAWESRIVEIGNTYPEKGIGVIVINSNDPAAYAGDSFDAMKERAKD